jgi:hypothetical protein
LDRALIFEKLRERQKKLTERFMPKKKHGLIIETPTEARQAEPGPSVLALLTISASFAVLILGAVLFAFFRI